jgi:DNA adenine methylase
MSVTPVKPIVKWAGGKTRLLGELLQRIPTRFGTYAEPFAGGAALFFALAGEAAGKGRDRRAFQRAILGDQNDELVACYRAVKRDVGAVIEALGAYKHDRDLFYVTRDRVTAGMTEVERAARLLFLNRTCYNGLWRVNASGKFNVPFGRYKNPRILDEDALRAASRALRGVDIVHGDFLAITSKLGAGDFVYLDPPYVPLSKTAAFTSYAKAGFTAPDQERLARELHALKARGVMAMLSNADTPETRALYRGFALTLVPVPRSINSDPLKRGDARELIVTTYGPPGVHTVVERRRAQSA